MRRILALALLLTIASCTYNATISKKLAVASVATYSSDAEIAAWNCKVCSMFPLTKVRIIKLFRCNLS